MSDVGCELGGKVQVTYGARGIMSRGGGQGICEWFVVCADPELLTFKEMEELLDCKVDG